MLFIKNCLRLLNNLIYNSFINKFTLHKVIFVHYLLLIEKPINKKRKKSNN